MVRSCVDPLFSSCRPAICVEDWALEESLTHPEEFFADREELVTEAEITVFLNLTVHCPESPYLTASASNIVK